MKVYLNDRLVEAADAKVSVFDHGLLYGDGVFEGIRLYGGNIYRLDEHLERLERSARALMLPLPWSRGQIAEATAATCRANGLVDGYIRLLVTRGVGPLGLNPFTCKEPQLVIIADKIQLYPPEHYAQGLKIVTVASRRASSAALPPMIKSLNYLNNVLAKIEAIQAGVLEAVMLNDQGYVAECTGDNIFIVVKGVLHTPPGNEGALRGITRQAVIDLCGDLGLTIRETPLTRYDLWCADECFLTGTAAEVIPVVAVDGRVTGDGRPGPLTRRILDAFHARVSVDGYKI